MSADKYSWHTLTKKILFDVDRKIALVDAGLKTSMVVVRQNNPVKIINILYL